MNPVNIRCKRIYFNAVGLAYVDVAIANAIYERARDASKGTQLTIQEDMIFQHEKLADWVRISELIFTPQIQYWES